MSITVQKSNQLQSIAILMMLCLHLFNSTEYTGLFRPLIYIGNIPLSYYISLFSDACVPIFAFVSGYGLYFSYRKDKNKLLAKNIQRAKKLYLRYWMILIIFVVILGLLLNKEGYPGSWHKFLLSFSGIKTFYNGAWWYFTIYIAFIFTCKFWFQLLEKLNPYIYISLLLVIYIIAFYFRIYQSNLFDNDILHWVHSQAALYFCTLFQFMLGAFALKYNWNQKVFRILKSINYKNILAILGIVILIIFHGFVPNFIVAPFTALGFIFLFLQMNLSKTTNRVLDFFSPHSTNMWLIHMFFYIIYFKELIYAPQYPLLIFIWLIIWCILASYLINFLYAKLERLIL